MTSTDSHYQPMKTDHLHAALRSLALEHRLADTSSLSGDAVLIKCEAILHEITHGLLLGGIVESEKISSLLQPLVDHEADLHEFTVLRVVMRGFDRLGGAEFNDTVEFLREPVRLLEAANFRDKPPTVDSLVLSLSPAEQGVAAWLEMIVRQRAMRIFESKAC
jgi:hypothetical protein